MLLCYGWCLLLLGLTLGSAFIRSHWYLIRTKHCVLIRMHFSLSLDENYFGSFTFFFCLFQHPSSRCESFVAFDRQSNHWHVNTQKQKKKTHSFTHSHLHTEKKKSRYTLMSDTHSRRRCRRTTTKSNRSIFNRRVTKRMSAKSLKFNGMERNISLNLIEFYQWRAGTTHTARFDSSLNQCVARSSLVSPFVDSILNLAIFIYLYRIDVYTNGYALWNRTLFYSPSFPLFRFR